jgi:hypothetical protein
MNNSTRSPVVTAMIALIVLGTLSISFCATAAENDSKVPAALPPDATKAAVAPPATTPIEAAQSSMPKSPSFESNGLKATIDSVAGNEYNVSLSLLLQNTSKEKLMVAVISPPMGTHGGGSFPAVAVGGLAYCSKLDGARNPEFKISRAEHINFCLKGEKPELDLQSFTQVDAGSAVPITLALTSYLPSGSYTKIDLNKPFSFAMNIAVFKEVDLEKINSSNSLTNNKPTSLPSSLRYSSIGITSISLENKKP